MPAKDRTPPRSALDMYTRPAPPEPVHENVDVNGYTSLPVEEPATPQRRRATEERKTISYRLRPSITSAWAAWCSLRGYAVGPAVELAMQEYMARHEGEAWAK